MSTRANVTSSKKYRKDRISHLPESVVSNILSSLPIKDAVRTCVLSKSWKYKWTAVPVIDIHDKDSTKEAFINFMNRILVFSLSIKDLSLSCLQLYDPSCMTSWISAALKHDMESLKVKITSLGVVLPCSLLSGTSLRKLELNMPCTLKVWSHICFPNLKSMHLEGVEILNELSKVHTVKFSFPVLETLDLRCCIWLNVESVEIDAPALTMLKSTTDGRDFYTYSIKIIGCGLQKFESYGAIPENFILTGPQVLYAFFECNLTMSGYILDGLKISARVMNQLISFPNLEELEISSTLAMVMMMSQKEHNICLLNLRKLVLLSGDFGPLIIRRMDAILGVLDAAPSLKFLSIDMKDQKWYGFDGEEHVPPCVVSHLEEVRISNLTFVEPNLWLVKFLLKNGMQLKKFHLSGSCDTEKNELLEQLLMFPKCSACSIIAVISQ